MFGGDGALAAIAQQYGDGEAKRLLGAAAGPAAAAFEQHGPVHAGVGIVPRVLVDLMGVLELMKGAVDATVTVNYVEVYNDKLTDLISGRPITLFRVGTGEAAEQFRDGKLGEDETYTLQGASDLVVGSTAEVLRALASGEANKHKAATAMNERSSRAHSIFMVSLTQRHRGSVKRSRLHLVDLGGSEQVKRSKAEGETLQEAIDINSSLMVLGQVIDALVQKQSHVPYYQSKLTMLLQPALGGNARTTVIVACSPDRADADETLHALRFGERCGQVANKVASATASMGEVLKALDASIKATEAEIREWRAKGGQEAAEADAAAMASGNAAAVLKAKAAAGEVGSDYATVEDVAGKYLMAVDRLAVLQKRKKEIIGGGGSEGH